ncbi:MAG: hypothetical protein ACRD24_12705 [Terriglobales bacterium]
MATVESGSAAPDFVYATAKGESRCLSELWQGRPALVLWLRHFG